MINNATNQNLFHALRLTLLLGAVLLTPVMMAQTIREFPPSLPGTFSNVPLNGGRVQSIAVSPTNRDHIIAAHQFGGLWQTTDGGLTWSHLNGLQEVWVTDVAYGTDGRTVIATVQRDLRRPNGGGIWVSPDEGATWYKPVTGNVPATIGGLVRTSAYGISYAPDNRERTYVGTDYGIAISNDNGVTWIHRLLEPTGPGAYSVQGLPRNRAIAVTQGTIYAKEAASDTWQVIRRGWFSQWSKNIDVSPYDYDKVFILENYDTLLLYEVAARRWTEIPLPGGGSRGPFVRAARGVGPQTIDLWVGLGVNLYKSSCADIECVRRLRCVRRPDLPPEPCDWRPITEGLHNDSGHLGLDAQKRPVMYGSDGGLFKPVNPEATSWMLASPGGSGMNSYQITSLAGTNYASLPGPSLYFATQDNGLWASPDGGRTWPNSDCAEGWHMQTWHRAASTDDPAARVAYGAAGCWWFNRVSDANLLNQRDATNVPLTGPVLAGHMYESFLLSPGNWVRFVNGPPTSLGSIFLSISTDNLEHWQPVGTTRLNLSSSIFRSGGLPATPTTYATFEGARIDRSGHPRIALARMTNILNVRPGEIVEENLKYLPEEGSLGIRATEFDWHPVYGVDPRNPNFLIAPDVVNGIVWYSTSWGDTWRRDDASRVDSLTNQVTQGGRLFFFDGLAGQVQVTNIAFSPYDPNLIMVGTREAGVIYSWDHGDNWATIPGSGAMLYVTGFFFSPDATVYVSTYGRGLWKMDMTWRWHPYQFPIDLYCPGDCLAQFRFIRDEPDPKSIRDFAWREYNVLVVTGGRINGLIRSGEEVKSITVTLGSSYSFYTVAKQTTPDICESKDGAGFQDDPAAKLALKNHEVITAVIFKGRKPVGYLTNKREFRLDQKQVAPKGGKEVPADKPGSGLPYLSVNTESSIGPGLVQTGGVVRIFGTGFMTADPAEILLDGKVLTQTFVEENGSFSYTLRVGDELSMGQHLLEVTQKGQQEERKAVATFVKVRGPDRFERAGSEFPKSPSKRNK